jgi:putative oligomerization/nucleic acid binding protein
LLVVASFLTFVAIFSFWVNRQAMNTDNWVDTSSKLLENEEVQAQLATFLVTQLYANVDVEAELQKALPPQASALAGPAAGGLRQLAQQVAERALATPQVQAIWAKTNRAAHEQFLAVINGGGSVVSTGEGEVTLQLGTVVTQVGEQTGIPADLTAKLPEDAGELKILDSEQLSALQKIAKAIRKLPIVLTALLILLYGGAIYLARGRRRETVRATGLGFIIAGALALLAREIAGNSVTSSLAKTASVEPAVEATWDIGTSLLVTVAVSAIAFGTLAVIAAWLAGRTAPAVALRRAAAPYFRERQAAAYGVAVVIWLALIAWAPIAAFRKPFGIFLFAVLFAIGTEALRRQAISEFPREEPGRFGERVRELFNRLMERGSARGGEELPPTTQLEQLERLNSLRREGALSDDEFEAQKKRILIGT